MFSTIFLHLTEVTDMTVWHGHGFDYTWLYFTDECETREPRINYWVSSIVANQYITFDLKDWSFVTKVEIKNGHNVQNDNG